MRSCQRFAREAGIVAPLMTIANDFDRTPLIADPENRRRYWARDLDEAGGVPVVLLRAMLDSGKSGMAMPTCCGKTLVRLPPRARERGQVVRRAANQLPGKVASWACTVTWLQGAICNGPA